MKLDVGDMVKGIQQRIPFLGAPERIISELVDMLRDAHRIMLRLEETMDRLDKMAMTWDDRIAAFQLSPERLDRIEQALFNIERGMTSVEASFGALPRALRTRIDRGRKPTANQVLPPPPREPY